VSALYHNKKKLTKISRKQKNPMLYEILWFFCKNNVGFLSFFVTTNQNKNSTLHKPRHIPLKNQPQSIR
jgi:hypothetical protein